MCPALRDRVIAFDARRLPARPRLDRARVRGGQGPPDPRRAAGRHRPHARHRRRHRGGRRLARRQRLDRDGRDPPDECPPAGRARPRPRHDRGQGRPRHPRRAHPRARPRQLCPRCGWRPGLGRAGSGRLVVGGRRRGPGAAGDRPRGRRRDRDRRPRADPRVGRRARRGDPARDHVPRRPGDRGGRDPGGRHRHPRLVARWPPGGAVGGASRACRRRRHVLVSLDLGVAGPAPDRRRQRPVRARSGHPGRGPRRGRRDPVRSAAAPVAERRDHRRG